jgi:DNA invertase Pin-like site-specific DNA recombinase
MKGGVKMGRGTANQNNKVIGYLRVSTAEQEVNNQRLEILEYARKNKLSVDDFISISISSRKGTKARRIDELMQLLKPGDTLIVAELSRLGRSVGQVATIVDALIANKIKFVAIKENIKLNGDGTKDIQTTVMVGMFSLFAEIERQLISERTKAGLVAARAKGKLLGRPKGSKGATKLDGKEELILDELKYGVAKSAIARKMNVSRGSLVNFISSRGLE